MVEEFKLYKKAYKKGHLWHTYEVSNFGNVKLNGKIVNPHQCINKNGQKSYLYIGGFTIHKAVAELFIPNPENKQCVDHIDTNIENNRVDNLRWVTHKENLLNPISKERRIKALKGRKFPDNFSETQSKIKLQLYKEHPELREKVGPKQGNHYPKMSEAALHKPPVKEETKQKLSVKLSGENNPMYGKKLKDFMTSEEYDNWLLKQKNKGKLSEETKQKLSLKLSGEKNPMYGKDRRRWVNKDGIRHLIKKEELDNYLNLGWKQGQN